MIISPRQFITIEGVRVNLLITPSMFTITKDKGWKIEVDPKDISTITSAYLKLIYAAALNHVMANQITNPDYPDLAITYEQIEVWSIENTEEFSKMIIKMASLLSKSTKQINEESKEFEKKKKRTVKNMLLSLITRR